MTDPKTSTIEFNFNEDLARAVALRLEELRGPITDEMLAAADRAGEKGSHAWIEKLNSFRPMPEEMVKQAIVEGSAKWRGEKEKADADRAQAEKDAVVRMERTRNFLLALCDREHGEFEALDNDRLRYVAELSTKPAVSFEEWEARVFRAKE